jgi:amino acid permease
MNAEETAPLLEESSKTTLTLGQATFHIINIIMGLGFLAIPYCFSVVGWVFGFVSFLLIWFSMNWTAKLVGVCLEYKSGDNLSTIPAKPKTSFPDLAELAFGGTLPRNLIAALFTSELLMAKTAIVIVAAENLDVFLNQPTWLVKIGVCFIMWITTFVHLKYLSFTSLVGMLASSWIVSTVVVDGLLTHSSPGSLLNPMPTTLGPRDVKRWWRVFLAPSVIMSCLSGHAVFPSIHLVMRNKAQFATAVNRAFFVVGSLYIIIATCGYLSFGEDTLDQITKNLSRWTSGDTSTREDSIKLVMTQIALGFMVLIPLTKFALLAEPVALHLARSVFVHKDTTPIIVSEEQFDNDSDWRDVRPPWRSGTLVYDSTRSEELQVAPLQLPDIPTWRLIAIKTGLTLLCLGLALLFPNFVGVVGIMGSALSCTTSILFPCAVYLSLYFPKHEAPLHPLWKKRVTWVVFSIGVLNALAGTSVAILEAM